jgi:hypothetical protein
LLRACDFSRGWWGFNKDLTVGNTLAKPVNGVLSEWAVSFGDKVVDDINYIIVDSGSQIFDNVLMTWLIM